jgi:hypothetical protein
MTKLAQAIAFLGTVAVLAACGGSTQVVTPHAPPAAATTAAPAATAATSVPTAGPTASAPTTGSPTTVPATGTPTAAPTAVPSAVPTAVPSAVPTTAPVPETTRTILPSTTNVNANNPDLPHLVANPNPNVPQRHKLFLFLPGTDAYPTDYTYVIGEAAAQGYHAIGLEYFNLVEIDVECEDQQSSCYSNVHLNTILGQSVSPYVVTPANSVVNRTVYLLEYLAKTYPLEGWGQYLDANDNVIWSKVVMSGHSQGGSHAGYMAKELFAMSRLCFFSSPDDTNTKYGDAGWETDATHMTPASQMWAFINTADTVEKPADDYREWGEIGLGNDEVSVDTTSPPYGNSHTLVTSHAPADTGDPIGAHDEPVLDLSTPVVNGVPLHKPVWDNNCFN